MVLVPAERPRPLASLVRAAAQIKARMAKQSARIVKNNTRLLASLVSK